MIEVILYQNKQKQYRGFSLIGHAEYADPGEDIICAAVSALTINTINSLENFTTEVVKPITNEEEGLIYLMFEKTPGHDGQLLLKSLALGLQEIQKSNGNEYMNVIFEEV